MVVLARSLILGYGIAGGIAVWLYLGGAGALVALGTAWIGGACLGLAIVAALTRPRRAAPPVETRVPDEKEYARWDADLMREFFEVGAEVDADTPPTPAKTGALRDGTHGP